MENISSGIFCRVAGLGSLFVLSAGCGAALQARPNILFVIADDQSWPYASAYGCRTVATPAFDSVAARGVLFNNAYATSPGSSPSRASILTGLYPWQIEEAGTHASSFPERYTCFPDIFAGAGYHVGYTGKGWGPGNWKVSGRKHNPAGPEYNSRRLDAPAPQISSIDYTANFRDFLDRCPEGAPFCFWLGTNEPHRPYENGSWERAGLSLGDAAVPGFLPDAELVRGDIMDYAVEIAWLDSHLERCIDELRRRGELENTIIIVTADNGMAFPRAKATCYDAGIHVPLAMCWGSRLHADGAVDTPVSLVDILPTLIDLTGISTSLEYDLSGESLRPLLESRERKYSSNAVFAGRERHASSRYANAGYPIRCIRSGEWLLIRNFHPERWPAGDPREMNAEGVLQAEHSAYHDIDGAPTKSFLLEHREDAAVREYFEAAVAKHPEYELYNLKSDPFCMTNLAAERRCAKILKRLKRDLHRRLAETGDPRVGDNPEIWESYPRLAGSMRSFPQPE